jgi:hypothetical protein
LSKPRQFAVLQKEAANPSADQLKRAFRSFRNLTDADAVRLAAESRGILMRNLGHDAARALQSALFAEGLQTALVAEDDLPRLPEARLLHRIELSPKELKVHDLLGRSEPIEWPRFGLVAAAAVQHVGITSAHSERSTIRLSPLTGVRVKTTAETVHRLQSDTQLWLELLLDNGAVRLQVHADEFPFGYLIERPEWQTLDKFLWLLRQICTLAPGAVLNAGAQQAVQTNDIPVYRNRQSLTDEIIWLLWHRAHSTIA